MYPSAFRHFLMIVTLTLKWLESLLSDCFGFSSMHRIICCLSTLPDLLRFVESAPASLKFLVHLSMSVFFGAALCFPYLALNILCTFVGLFFSAYLRTISALMASENILGSLEGSVEVAFLSLNFPRYLSSVAYQ